jgi:hypothetical protein
VPFDPTRFRWPIPWRPLTDEVEALSFGRFINPNIATTVLDELKREICDRHPLAGVACRPVAWEAGSRKDFLFLTARPDMPVALVHFTWAVQEVPDWPFVIGYRSLEDFVRRERNWVVELRVRVQRWWGKLGRQWSGRNTAGGHDRS